MYQCALVCFSCNKVLSGCDGCFLCIHRAFSSVSEQPSGRGWKVEIPIVYTVSMFSPCSLSSSPFSVLIPFPSLYTHLTFFPLHLDSYQVLVSMATSFFFFSSAELMKTCMLLWITETSMNISSAYMPLPLISDEITVTHHWQSCHCTAATTDN